MLLLCIQSKPRISEKNPDRRALLNRPQGHVKNEYCGSFICSCKKLQNNEKQHFENDSQNEKICSDIRKLKIEEGVKTFCNQKQKNSA